MFEKKKFISDLDVFEISNKFDISSEEMNAIMEVCMNDPYPVYLAVYMGFQCGCMKAGNHYE